MPPKKSASKGKQSETTEKKESNIPTNECMFKISINVKQEAGHYLKIKYDWISVNNGAPEGEQITFPVTDTGYFRDWNLI